MMAMHPTLHISAANEHLAELSRSASEFRRRGDGSGGGRRPRFRRPRLRGPRVLRPAI